MTTSLREYREKNKALFGNKPLGDLADSLWRVQGARLAKQYGYKDREDFVRRMGWEPEIAADEMARQRDTRAARGRTFIGETVGEAPEASFRGLGALRRGFQTYVPGMIGGLTGWTGSVMEGAGLERPGRAIKEAGYGLHQRSMERAAKDPKSVEFEHALKSPAHFASWVGESIIEFLPQMAMMTVGGKAALAARGISAVRGGLNQLFSRRVAREAAKLQGTKVAGKTVSAAAAKRMAQERVQTQMLARIGAGVQVTGMYTGSNWAEALERFGIDAPLSAGVTGAGAGLLTMVIGGQVAAVEAILGRRAANVFAKALQTGDKGTLKRIGTEFLKVAPKAAIEEFGQESLALLNAIYQDPDVTRQFDTVLSEYLANIRRPIESAATVAVAAGVPGAVARGTTGRGEITSRDVLLDPDERGQTPREILLTDRIEPRDHIPAPIELDEIISPMKPADESAQVFVEQEAVEKRLRQSPEGRKLLREQLAAEEKGEPTPFQKLVDALYGKRGRYRKQELTEKEIEDREFEEWRKKARWREVSEEEYEQARKVVDRLEEDEAFRKWYIRSQKSYAEKVKPREEIKPATAEEIDAEAHEAATSPRNEIIEPTDAQKEAGNYKKGHISVQGLEISIENPEGSERKGTDPDGKPWSVTMQHHYGYFKRSEGKDGDQIDVIVGENPESRKAYIVDQVDPKTGKFDEHKTLIGFNSEAEARAGYLANYEEGWQGLGAITEMPIDDFKEWVRKGRQTKPVAPIEAPTAVERAEPIPDPAPPVEAAPAAEKSPVKAETEAVEKQPWEMTREGYIQNAPRPDKYHTDKFLTGYHSAAVKKALSEGKSVPPEVLADYPDLAPKPPVEKAKAEPKEAPKVEKSLEDKFISDLQRKGAARVGLTDYQILQTDDGGFYYRKVEDGARIEKGPGYPAKWTRAEAIDKALEDARYDLEAEQKKEVTAQPDAAALKAEDATAEDLLAEWDRQAAEMESEKKTAEKKVPEFKEGDRVVLKDMSSSLDGRHGSIVKVDKTTWRMAPIFGGQVEERTDVRYKVKTDAGYIVDFASDRNVEAESESPPAAVPDIEVNPGEWQTPEMVKSWADNARSRARNTRAAAQRARKPDRIAALRRQAEKYENDASVAQAQYDAWAERHAPDQARETVAERPSTGSLEDYGLVVSETTTKTGKRVWEVSGNTKEHSQVIKNAGGRWYGPKKVWSFYNTDPTQDILDRLPKKAVAVAPSPVIVKERAEAGPRELTKAEQAQIKEIDNALRKARTTEMDFAYDLAINDKGERVRQVEAKIADLNEQKRRILEAAKPAEEKSLFKQGERVEFIGYRSREKGTGTIAEDYRPTSPPENVGISGDDGMFHWAGPDEIKRLPEKPTATEKAKETADHIKNAIDKFKEINKILGEEGVFSQEQIDLSKYEKIKPLLQEAWEEILAAGKSAKEFVQIALQSLSPKGRPYFEKFVREEVSHGPDHVARRIEGEAAPADDQRGIGREEPGTVPRTEEVEAAGEVPERSGRRDDVGVPGRVERGTLQERRGEDRAEKPDRKSSRVRGRPAEPVGRDTGNVPGILSEGTDHVIQRGGITREGSWKAAAKNNLDAIELSKKIHSENRPATREEQDILAKYVGWGSTELANNMFPGYAWAREVRPGSAREGWGPLVERLKAVLTDEEIAAAARSTQNAHYTSEGVVRGIHRALVRFGFDGGRMIDPGSGISHFAGLIPASIREKTFYTGIEMDPVSANIAKLLYPNHHIVVGDYTKTPFPKDFFDAAAGNPPFSQTKILADPEYRKHRFSLHNYFFAKTLDRVRPGGVLAFVTSHYTLDAQSKKVREHLSKSADFLGAIRLPQSAFKENAGTEVVTDVIFLKKRVKGEAPAGESWLDLAEVETSEGTVLVNEYFVNHPEMVLGRHSRQGSMYAKDTYTVLPLDQDIDALFSEAVDKLPEGVYSQVTENAESLKEQVFERDHNPKIKKEGGVYLSDKGELKIVEYGSGVDIAKLHPKLSQKDQAWLKDYVGLRDVLKQAHYDQLTDGEWEKSLASLQRAYRSFTKKHGKILDYTLTTRKEKNEDGEIHEITYRRQKNDNLLQVDTEGSRVSALETITESGEIVESSVLSERIIRKPEDPKIETIGDALAVSLNNRGRLEIPHIAELMNIGRQEVIESLGDLVFKDPAGDFVMSDEYLSGDVVKKLKEAQAAAEIDPQYKRNVEALKKVQPDPLGPKDITVSPGSTWIPTKYLSSFGKEVLGLSDCRVRHFPASNAWQVTGRFRKQGTRSAGEEFGTADRGPNEIFETALNNRAIKITRTDPDTKKTYTDTAATTAANEKLKALKERFGSWVWQDGDRAKDLLSIYNEQFNNLAPRHFDGSHLTLPGASNLIKLYPHQKRAIWRIIQTGNSYLAHSVGAGKTFVMIASGMEMKRLGLISKPLYVVPKHMLGQFAREFNELYPMAHVMVADEKNFHTENRRRFIAQATMNNPDAIVIPHSSFGLLSLKEETIKPIRDDHIAQLRYAWEEMEDAGEPNYILKQMERRIEQAEQKFDSLIAQGDKAIEFEEMGVDYLFVDEAHEFRKLDYVTNQKIKGIDPIGSKRAIDLFIKTLWLEKQNPERSHSFASGTPITNTIGELYNVMRFFDPAGMEESGIDHFDSWSANFARAAVGYEMNTAGEFKAVERFSRFINIPELMSRVRQFMDVLTMSQLGSRVKLPKIRGGKPEVRVSEAIPEMKAYQRDVLQPRIEASMRWKPSPGQPGNPDPLINIITDGRLASIDMRFVEPAANNPQSKLNRFIDGIIETCHQTKDNEYLEVDGKRSTVKGAAQICFYNHGFGDAVKERRGFDARAWVMERLKEANIPAKDVAWISDYKSAVKREALFKDLRSGKKRILFGSAKKMGTGMNIQTRLSHLHYLDPPWYPADVEQPLGRIIRQGNQNEEVDIRWYATRGSYDATMWQLVAMKSKFIEKAFLGEKDLRTMEDVSEASQYEMASALATGDERVVRLVALRTEVERYSNLKTEYENDQRRLGWKRTELNNSIGWNEKHIERLNRMESHLPHGHLAFDFGQIGKKHYDKRNEFAEALTAAFTTLKTLETTDVEHVGKIGVKSVGEATAAIDIYRVVSSRDSNGKPSASAIALRFEEGLEQKWAPDDFSPTRAINFLNKIGSEIDSSERSIRSSKEDLAEIEKRLDAPFEYEREYHETIADVARLEQELAAEGEAETLEMQALSEMSEAEASENRKELLDTFVTDVAVQVAGKDSKKREETKTLLADAAAETYIDGAHERAVETLIEQELFSEKIEERLINLRDAYFHKEAYLDYPAVIGRYPDFGKSPLVDSRTEVRLSQPPTTPTGRTPKGLSVTAVQKVADNIAKKWRNPADEITVVKSIDDIKEGAVRNALDPNLTVRAAFATNRSTGARKIYLVADNMDGPRDVVFSILEEGLGHDGLRQTFGDRLPQFLDTVYSRHKAEVDKVADAYGLDTSKEAGRREATDEWISKSIAENSLPQRIWDRIVAAIRSWVRKAFPGLNVSVAEARDMARRAIERGERFQGEGMSLATADIRRSMAGRRARTADTGLLARAQEMKAQGKSEQEIWESTGWIREASGKWAFRIDDSGAKLTDKVTRPSRRPEPWLEWGTVEKFLDHPELFKAYPQLKDVLASLEIGPHIQTNRGHYSSPVDRSAQGLFDLEPTIEIQAKSQEKALSIMLHEVQHAIQDIEGFARGGTPWVAAISPEIYNEALRPLHEKLKKVELKDDGELGDLARKYWSDGLVGRDFNRLENLRQKNPATAPILDEIRAAKGERPYKIYKRLAGEIYAREAGAFFTGLPGAMEGIPRDQWIVRDGEGTSFSITPDPGRAFDAEMSTDPTVKAYRDSTKPQDFSRESIEPNEVRRNVALQADLGSRDGLMSDVVESVKGVFTRRGKNWVGVKADLTTFETTLGLLSHAYGKSPALDRAFTAATNFKDMSSEIKHDLIQDPVTGRSTTDFWNALYKANKKTAEAVGNKLIEDDIHERGYRVFEDDQGVHAYTKNAVKHVSTHVKKADAEMAAQRLRERMGDKVSVEVREGDKADQWHVVQRARGKKIGTFAREEEAWAAARQHEVEQIRKLHGDLAAEAVRVSKGELDRGFVMLTENLRQLYRKKLNAGLPPTVEYTTMAGELVQVNLQDAIARIGDLRGHYFPRLRRPGQYMVYANKEGERTVMQTFDKKAAADAYEARMIKRGWKTRKTVSSALPEDVFDMWRQVVGVQTQINEALSRIQSGKVTLEDFGLQHFDRGAEGRRDFVVFGPIGMAGKEVFKAMGGQWFSAQAGEPKGWHFINPGRNFEQRLAKALAAKVDVVDQRMTDLFAQALTENMANVIREHGHRAHMIRRRQDIVVGYETDPRVVFAKYAHGIATGQAKGRLSMQLARAGTGTDISWNQYKGLIGLMQKNEKLQDYETFQLDYFDLQVTPEEHKAMVEIGKETAPETPVEYQHYRNFMMERRIDPAKQPNAFKAYKQLSETMLRNQEASERVVGFLKGLAVFKYLAFRVFSAPLINLTALPTSATAAMSGYAGVSLPQSMGYIARGIKAYGQFRLGRTAGMDPDIVRLFTDMRRKGWDNPQFNMEAFATLQNRFGRAWSKLIDWGMYTFGASETLNRASTISGAYMALKDQAMRAGKKFNHKEAMAKAKEISDKSHGIYDKANKPMLIMGAGYPKQTGQAYYMYRTFAYTYLLTMRDLGFKLGPVRFGKGETLPFLYMLVAPAMLAGAGASVATPFIAAMLKGLTDSDDPEEDFYRWLYNEVGAAPERAARFGLFGLAGVNLKGSLEIGLMDLPTKATELLGAPGSVLTDVYHGMERITKGDISKGVEQILPLGWSAPIKSYREASEGLTTRTNAPLFYGRDRVKLEGHEVALRALAFNPARISGIREEQWSDTRSAAKWTERKQDINARIKKFYLLPPSERTKKRWADILAMVQDYNERARRTGAVRRGVATFITSDSIRQSLRMSFQPSKRERFRAAA